MSDLDFYIEFFELMAQNLVDGGRATPAGIAGCTTAEIASIESQLNVSLPVSYRAYLLVMGHRAGYLWDVDQALGTDLLLINQMLQENLAINQIDGTNVFGFHMHDGFAFYLFDLSQKADDPTILHYVENRFLQTECGHESPITKENQTFCERVDGITGYAKVTPPNIKPHNLRVYLRRLKAMELDDADKTGRKLGTDWLTPRPDVLDWAILDHPEPRKTITVYYDLAIELD